MSLTELRDRATRLAKEDASAALVLAREIPDPRFSAQALAAVARWGADAEVESVAAESLSCAEGCGDDYQRAAVAAWPIRALLERGCAVRADEALGVARCRALAATPAGSRAEALLGLLQHLLREEPFVRALARRLVAEEAENVVQQTFLRSLERAPTAVEAPRGWLARVVRNLAKDLRWRPRATAKSHESPGRTHAPCRDPVSHAACVASSVASV